MDTATITIIGVVVVALGTIAAALVVEPLDALDDHYADVIDALGTGTARVYTGGTR